MDVVGASHVLTEAAMIAGYIQDWTGRWTGDTVAVVRPANTEEVSAIMSICLSHEVAVVPQGGNTGLVGGSIPHRGEIVLSVRRLDGLANASTSSVVAGAGATIASVDALARRSGLMYPVDLASRDSATVGGTIATNAGGLHVVAYGDTRRQVLGLEVVLADGSVLDRLTKPPKESVGPELVHNLIGSEGTLGVITAARLRLLPIPRAERFVTLVAIDRLSDGLGFLSDGVTALEFFDERCLRLVIEHRGLPSPLPGNAPFYVLIESSELPEVGDADAVVDERLWKYREAITETINAAGVPCKLDVAVPIEAVDLFVSELTKRSIEGEMFVFGHLAEGNFHVNVVGGDPSLVEHEVLSLVVALGGAIASEHGIGVAKAEWWRRSTEPALVDLARGLKAAFDPRGILNPEVFWGG